MIRTLLEKLNRLPIRWRFTIWSSVLMCLLFFGHNAVQYAVVYQWSTKQVNNDIQKQMDEIVSFLSDTASEDLNDSRSFLDQINQKNQMIRILDRDGHPVITVSDDLPETWVAPKPAAYVQLTSAWHYQEHFLIIRAPISKGSFTGTVEIVRNLETFERLNKFILLVMAVGGLLSVAVSSLAGLLLARQFLKPISALADTMGRIKHTGLSERVTIIDNDDELSRLGRMFNDMMNRLEQSFQKQKQFVEDASHELRTPIAIVEGHLSMLQRWGKKDQAVLDDSLDAALQEVRRLRELTQEMLALSRAESLAVLDQEARVEPVAILRRIVEDFSILHPEFRFEMQLDALAGVVLSISEHHFKQILMIFIDNAILYSGERKIIVLNAKKDEDSFVRLHIQDFGIGIPAEEIPFLFDRFYRVDKARSRKQGGSGLGLSIAKRIIEAYRGTVAIESVEREGTTVTVTLPAQLLTNKDVF